MGKDGAGGCHGGYPEYGEKTRTITKTVIEADPKDRAEISRLLKRNEVLAEALLDVFNQACQTHTDPISMDATYDHMCLSAYERAQDLLIENGLINKKQCVR
jgi:hypothetical protein